MSLVQGKISQKYGFKCVPFGCVRFVRNCGKMYSRHLFLYGGSRSSVKLLSLIKYSEKKKKKDFDLSHMLAIITQLTAKRIQGR